MSTASNLDSARRSRQAQILRIARKTHRTTGVTLFVFFFIVASSGLLLGWKKHSGGMILPETHQGRSVQVRDWMPIEALHASAIRAARKHIASDLSLELERIDIRPDKGVAKFVFVEGYWGVQIDCTTGELLHIERRRSDLIENIHDGSIVDHVIDTEGETFKLGYTTIMATALLLFTISGFWLWFGPKRIRRRREK